LLAGFRWQQAVIRAKLLDAPDPCPAPSAAPAAEIALLPAGLSFDQVGTVTRVWKDERHVMVKAVTTKPIDEATLLIQEAVTAAGYRPAGIDSEGVEAAVFWPARFPEGRRGCGRPAAKAGRTSTSSSSTCRK
jgi:hypothetical protein